MGCERSVSIAKEILRLRRGQASIAYARLRARPPVSLRSCLAPALRASLIAYRRIAYKSTLTVFACELCSFVYNVRFMLIVVSNI
jgi:hypothetical protein